MTTPECQKIDNKCKKKESKYIFNIYHQKEMTKKIVGNMKYMSLHQSLRSLKPSMHFMMMSFGRCPGQRGLGWVTLGGTHRQEVETLLILKADVKNLVVQVYESKVDSQTKLCQEQVFCVLVGTDNNLSGPTNPFQSIPISIQTS